MWIAFEQSFRQIDFKVNVDQHDRKQLIIYIGLYSFKESCRFPVYCEESVLGFIAPCPCRYWNCPRSLYRRLNYSRLNIASSLFSESHTLIYSLAWGFTRRYCCPDKCTLRTFHWRTRYVFQVSLLLPFPSGFSYYLWIELNEKFAGSTLEHINVRRL